MTYSGKKQPASPKNSSSLKQKKSRIFQKLAMGFAGLLALLIILILSVDLNTFREPVTEALSRATGMKIKIKFMDWSFSEGLKFKCKGVQILSGETEEELVSTEELLVKLNWLPLLQRQVVIKSITLVRPVLKISIQPPHRNDILPQSEQPSSDFIPNLSPLMEKKPPSPNWLHNVREFLKKPNLTLTEINLIAGQVILQDKGAGKEALLNAEARMRINREGSRVGLVLDGMKLGIGNLMAQGEIRTDDFLLQDSLVRANIQIQPFKVSDLLPVLQWIPEIQKAFNKKLKLKGDFHELKLKIETPVDTMTDFESIVKSANAELVLKAQEVSLVQFGKTISASTIEAAIQWIDQQWAHKIALSMLEGDFETQGKIIREQGSESALDWKLDSQITLERVNMHELRKKIFNQVTWFPKKGMLTGKVHVQGPVLRPQLIRVDGTVSTRNVTFPLQGTDVSIAGMEGSGRWLGGRLSHQFRMTAFGGEISIQGDLNFKKDDQGHWDPVIDSEVMPQSIKLADLRPLVQKDWFPKKGILTGKVHVQGPVLRAQAIKAEGKLRVQNTAIQFKGKNINLAEIKGKGLWSKDHLSHHIKTKLFGGEVSIKGDLNFKKNNQGELDPVIDSEVIPQSLQLASIRPLVQKDWFPNKGILTGKVHVQGPVLRAQAIKVEGKLRVQNTAIQFEGKNINLAHMEGKGLWSEDHLSHQIQMKVFGGEVSVQGDLNFKKNNQGELDPVIDSEVIPQSVQLSSLRPLVQNEWFPEEGTLTGKVHLKGPVKRFSEITLIGNLAGKKVILKIEEKPVIFQKTFLSFEPNAQKNILIDFNLSDISVGKLSLKKSTGKVVFSKRTFELKQGKIWPKTGVFFLNGVYKYKSKDYEFEFSGKGLRWEDFKANYLEGPLSLKGDLFGSILSEGFKKGLSGNLVINSKNGRILKAGPIFTKILDILNFKIIAGVDEVLRFDSLGGNCTIKNGILFTENFKMISPSVNLLVSGKADLSDEKVDAEIIAQSLLTKNKVFDKLDELMGGFQLFGDKRKEGEQSEDWIKAYFSINGNFEELEVDFLPEKTFMFK